MARDLAGLAWRQRRTATWEDLALGAVGEPGNVPNAMSHDAENLDADAAMALEERARLAARAVLTDGVLHKAIDVSGRLRRDFARLLDQYYKTRDA